MLVYVIHKTRRCRAKRGKEMYKKRDARAKLLFCRQRERQNNNFARPSRFFCTFLSRRFTTTT